MYVYESSDVYGLVRFIKINLSNCRAKSIGQPCISLFTLYIAISLDEFSSLAVTLIDWIVLLDIPFGGMNVSWSLGVCWINLGLKRTVMCVVCAATLWSTLRLLNQQPDAKSRTWHSARAPDVEKLNEPISYTSRDRTLKSHTFTCWSCYSLRVSENAHYQTKSERERSRDLPSRFVKLLGDLYSFRFLYGWSGAALVDAVSCLVDRKTIHNSARSAFWCVYRNSGSSTNTLHLLTNFNTNSKCFDFVEL